VKNLRTLLGMVEVYGIFREKYMGKSAEPQVAAEDTAAT
jgi:hypothetical protein